MIHKYEKKNDALISSNSYAKRIGISVSIAFIVLLFFWGIGIIGYHYIANITWIDSIHNAAMILGGMGPVVEIKTNAGKLFSSFYALICGIVFITNIGIILAPVVHRISHRLHLED
jgi:hypothetical protein